MCIVCSHVRDWAPCVNICKAYTPANVSRIDNFPTFLYTFIMKAVDESGEIKTELKELRVGNPILLCSVLGFMVGLVWLGYDIIMWLKHDAWMAVSLSDFLIKIGANDFVQWAYFPRDWIGVSKIFKIIIDTSVSTVILLISAVAFVIGMVMTSRVIPGNE